MLTAFTAARGIELESNRFAGELFYLWIFPRILYAHARRRAAGLSAENRCGNLLTEF